MNVQLAAACDTVKVCPAIVSVPVRVDELGFAATEKSTDPSPLPLDPLLIVIQALPLAASHEQPAPAGPVAVYGATGRNNRLTRRRNGYAHAAPACVTLNVWPPTVRVPVR